MAKIRKFFFLASIVLIFYGCRIAPHIQKTLYVPDEFSSLEGAIQHSVSGDTIVVLEGRYEIAQSISIIQKNLTILSALGAEKTILVGRGVGPVISFARNCQAILNGFTITSSKSNPSSIIHLQGGGIYCAPFSSPTIINNVIKNNEAQFGGGIYCAFSSTPRIIQNTITSNYAHVSGGGLFSSRAFPRIVKNRFIQNRAGSSGGGIFCSDDNALIQNNIIIQNKAFHSGGGCSSINTASVLINNTFSGNEALFGGGVFGTSGEFQLLNNILWKNKDDLCLIDIKMISRPKFSDITDGDYLGINGNISLNPLFIDPNRGDYRLQNKSPCRHAGDPRGSAQSNAEAASRRISRRNLCPRGTPLHYR